MNSHYWLLRNFYFEKTYIVGNTYSILVILRDIDRFFFRIGFVRATARVTCAYIRVYYCEVVL